MSKKPAKVSDPEHDDRSTASVYDFLYHDVRRVGSFISQFDASGLLQSIKETDSLGESKGSKAGATASGGLPPIARGQAHFEDQVGSERREASERTYDPLWQNALALLDFLSERKMIGRDISRARIGQFVLTSGHLLILDLAMLQAAWEKPAIKKAVLAGVLAGSASPIDMNRQQRRAGRSGKPAVDEQPEVEMMFALLSMLPHSLQARLLDTNGSVWCSLDEAAIVGRSSDLVLKHGALISGRWNMLGVLDASPYDPNHTTDDGQPFNEVLAKLVETPVGQIAAHLAPVAQGLLGRPPGSYGMTPLMIFREVVAGDEDHD